MPWNAHPTLRAAWTASQKKVVTTTYSYAGTGGANPDAVTKITSGASGTTYAYDLNGNLTSAGNGVSTTTYSYDYNNRLIALLLNGATSTTYGYDAFGTRVYQISATSSTTTYPYKFYSVASTTNGSTNFATSTEYAFNGDTLLETVDQAFKNGAATGTPQTRYVHPDHLGSTDVVTDQNQNVVQTLDYYPYGATRISVATSTRERRQFIGQFTDDSSLSYLNARYMDPSRGQFLSQEQIYLALGDRDRAQQLAQRDQQAYLSHPQRLNMYTYGKDNPIGNKDTSGLKSRPSTNFCMRTAAAKPSIAALMPSLVPQGKPHKSEPQLKPNLGMMLGLSA
jgi:RHS repeat-associated protein